MNRNRLLLLGGVVCVGVLGVLWYLSQAQNASGAAAAASSATQSATNAVNNAAQVGAGAYAQGTMPDYGNLLWENVIPGTMSAPQATSVNPITSDMAPQPQGVTGG